MATRAALPTLRAFLGAVGLAKSTAASAARGLYSLRQAFGQEPLTESDTAVRDVVNAIVTAIEGPSVTTVPGLGVEGSAVADVDARYLMDSSSADAFLKLPKSPTLGRRITVYADKGTNAITVSCDTGGAFPGGGKSISMHTNQSITVVCINATGPVWAVESAFANGLTLSI